MSVAINGSGTITGLTATGISAQPVFAGNVLQVVSTTKTDTFSTASTSFVDITGLSVSITPTSTSSKILVMFSVPASALGSAAWHLNLVRNSTNIVVGNADGARTRATVGSYVAPATQMTQFAYQYLDAPASTSAQTYKLQLKTQSSFTAYVNRTATDTDNVDYVRTTSTITLMEIAG